MPTTTVHALRYPAPTDPADVPSDMGKLASDVDVALLPADVVCAAATRVVRSLLVAGDANGAFRIMGDGRHDWGAGGASAVDTSLYRSAVNTLKASGTLVAGQGGAGGPAFVADSLAADGYTLLAKQAGDTQNRFMIDRNGALNWGPGNAATDTDLYRTGAGYLRTDGILQVMNMLQGYQPVYSMYGDSQQRQVSLGFSGANPAVYWGNDLGVGLVKTSTNHLATLGNNNLHVGQAFYAGDGQAAIQIALGNDGSGRGCMFFGTALDTSIIRLEAGGLGTNSWYVGGALCLTSARGGDVTGATRQYNFPVYNQNKTFLGYVQIYT